MAKEKEKKKIRSVKDLIIKASNWKMSYEDFRSTGILPLDIALKTGGYRKGRIIEIAGKEHSGKTLMSMLSIIWDQIIFQRPSLFVDAEGSFDIKWFGRLGGIMDLLDIYDPFQQKDVYGEDVYDNVIDLIDTGKYSFAIIDSLMGSALLSKELLKKDLVETARMGVQPKLNKAFFQKAFIKTNHTDTNLIITNHLVDKIGVMFGSPETTPGGNDLKFRAEQRLRIGAGKDKTDYGHTVRGKIWKNKRGASAGKEFSFYLDYNTGIDNYDEMIKMLMKEDIIDKKQKADVLEEIKSDYKVYEKYVQQLLKIEDEGEKEEIVEDDEDLEDFE